MANSRYGELHFGMLRQILKSIKKLGTQTQNMHDRVKAVEGLISGLPVGTMLPWSSGKKLPTDGVWMYCEGQHLTKASYSELYDILSADHVAGEATNPFEITDNTFSLPKADSRYLRFEKPTGERAGKHEDDRIQNITARTSFATDGNSSAGVGPNNIHGAFYGINDNTWAHITDANGGRDGYNELGFDASRVVRTGTTTQPRTLTMHLIIKVSS